MGVKVRYPQTFGHKVDMIYKKLQTESSDLESTFLSFNFIMHQVFIFYIH